MDAKFPYLHIDKARETHDNKDLNLITYPTRFSVLVSSSVRSKQLLCIVHGQGKKSEQKHTAKNFVVCHSDSTLWFAFNQTVHFRPKMALSLELPVLRRTYLGPVHMNPFSNENGTVLLRIRLSSTFQRRKRSPKTESFENALQSGAI